MLNLLHDGTEINSFDDVYDVESSITHFDGRIASYCDLLTREDAQSTRDGFTYFQMTTAGAYGLSYFLEDCKTMIRKLRAGYANIGRRLDRKQAKEENCPEEKQEQVALSPDFVLFEQMIDTIFSYQSKIKCACSIFYTLNGAADMSNMVKPEKVAEMINLMQVVNSSLQDLDKGFRSFFDDATGIPLRSIKELVHGELT